MNNQKRHYVYNNFDKEYEEKVVQIKRLSKKTKGGNKISFSALVVVGNRKGKVGIGLGKAPSTLAAIQKGIRLGKRNLFEIRIEKETIPHQIYIKHGAAKILLKPAPLGKGLIAGGPVRNILEAAGIKNIVAKILGTKNKASNIYATIQALKTFKTSKNNET